MNSMLLAQCPTTILQHNYTSHMRMVHHSCFIPHFLILLSGYFIEYIEGEVMTLTQMRDPSVYPLIAEKIAQVQFLLDASFLSLMVIIIVAQHQTAARDIEEERRH
jgi:hypothetical protein